MTGTAATLMAVAMIAAFLLAAGGLRLLFGSDRRKGWLMLAVAAVLVVNVAIWAV
ncbi:MAG: hypothetical protein ACT4OE_08330 [Sphingosinicella sp.]